MKVVIILFYIFFYLNSYGQINSFNSDHLIINRNNSIQKIIRKMIFFTTKDTIVDEFKVYRLKSDTTYFYKIIDVRKGITYFKDSSGFYIYTSNNNVLAKSEEPSNILWNKCFLGSENIYINNLVSKANYLDSNLIKTHKIYKFDSIVNQDKHFKTKVNVYFNIEDNKVDILEDFMWYEGSYQYRKAKLESEITDVNNIYDSIALQKQNLFIRLEINGDEYRKSLELSSINLLNKKAPPFSLFDLNGNLFNFYGQSSKYYLLDFHYKSCYPCWLNNAKLTSLNNLYKDNGLLILAINTIDSNSENVRNFYKQKNIDYKILFGSSDIANLYNVNSYPTIFLVDSKYKIIKNWSGYDELKLNELSDFLNINLNKN